MENIDVLEQQAIDKAIAGLWQEAIILNKKIIKIDKNNIDAYLRLGFANVQINNILEAKKYYKKSLKLQPSNNVAKEYLERIKILDKKTSKKNKDSKLSLDPNLFLEITGKTRSFVLVNLGQKNTLAHLTIGLKVNLHVRKRKIEFRDINNDYIGSLPDDISKRLVIFITANSKFSAYIKEASLNRVVIFLREEKKGKKVQRFSSFPQNIQSNLNEMAANEENNDDDDFNEGDLEKLAENLPSEEKDYLPYNTEEEEEAEE